MSATRTRRLRRPTKVTPARWAAWLTLRRTFEEDAWTDRAFGAVADQLGLADDPRERAFAQRLAYGTVQQAKLLDHVIAVLGKRPLRKVDPPVLHALRIGCYELLLLDGETSAHAAVDQAVELVRGVVGERAVAFTNAILRRAQVDGASIVAALDPADDADLATLLSMPEWLVTRVRLGHGERGVEALRAQNEPHAGTAFRVNAARVEAGAELPGTPGRLAAGARIVEGSTAAISPLVQRGVLVPQSEASQLVAFALGVQPGDRVADLCAAPGGKTTAIAAMLGDAGSVLAVELHEHRARSIEQLATRTGTADRIEVRVADSTQLDPEQGGRFDRVLLDAPCTGTGVLGARPDARWKRSEEGLDELVALQGRLLATAARLVRPGGVLVYSTCSILREEDEAIASLAGEHGLEPDPLPDAFGALRDEAAPHTARTWPHEHATDGFFIARFRRTEERS